MGSNIKDQKLVPYKQKGSNFGIISEALQLDKIDISSEGVDIRSEGVDISSEESRYQQLRSIYMLHCFQYAIPLLMFDFQLQISASCLFIQVSTFQGGMGHLHYETYMFFQ